MLPWLPWRAVITGRNQETDALCLTKNIISWVLLASLSHHVSLAVVRDPGLPRPGSGSCMSGWVKPWAAPVQPCLPGRLSIVLCTGQPGCWEDFLIALGMGALPRAPRGPNYRDVLPSKLASLEISLQLHTESSEETSRERVSSCGKRFLHHRFLHHHREAPLSYALQNHCLRLY